MILHPHEIVNDHPKDPTRESVRAQVLSFSPLYRTPGCCLLGIPVPPWRSYLQRLLRENPVVVLKKFRKLGKKLLDGL